jgi:hypothetical protein
VTVGEFRGGLALDGKQTNAYDPDDGISDRQCNSVHDRHET